MISQLHTQKRHICEYCATVAQHYWTVGRKRGGVGHKRGGVGHKRGRVGHKRGRVGHKRGRVGMGCGVTARVGVTWCFQTKRHKNERNENYEEKRTHKHKPDVSF